MKNWLSAISVSLITGLLGMFSLGCLARIIHRRPNRGRKSMPQLCKPICARTLCATETAAICDRSSDAAAKPWGATAAAAKPWGGAAGVGRRGQPPPTRATLALTPLTRH
jgi:hypothetical protein